MHLQLRLSAIFEKITTAMMTSRSESRQVSDNLPVQWSEAEQWFAELTKEFGYEYFFAGEID